MGNLDQLVQKFQIMYSSLFFIKIINYLEVGDKVIVSEGIKDDGSALGLLVGLMDGMIDGNAVGLREGIKEGV